MGIGAFERVFREVLEKNLKNTGGLLENELFWKNHKKVQSPPLTLPQAFISAAAYF